MQLSNNFPLAMQTVVNSWSKICHTLMRAEDGWWESNDDDCDGDEGAYDDMRMEEDDDDQSDGSFFETAPEI